MAAVAVLDVGKTNVKLSAVSREGVILETLSVANDPLSGPPYRHADVDAIEDWCLDNLRVLASRNHVDTLVATAHGSFGALVGSDSLLMPPVDYESELPEAVDVAYRDLAGPLQETGSAILPGCAHLARQILFLEMEWPERVAAARYYLGGPQFWAWRFSGVGASELTYLGAQTHLWDVRARRWLPIVAARGWDRLLPPLLPAWQRLGPLRSELVRRHDLPEDIAVLCGIHDSSANFYRYQQSGLSDLALVSTGTWIVGLADIAHPEVFTVTEQRIRNADVLGRPLAGVLTMGGREFSILAGEAPDRPAEAARAAALVAAGTMALPSFAEHDAVFPGTLGKGRIVGPEPAAPEDRRALAVLYAALVTDVCLDVMGENATTVLDGSFVKDPLYAGLVAALRPGKRTLYGSDAYGTAAGAGLLADHPTRTRPAAIEISSSQPLHIPGLAKYREDWRRRAGPAGIELGRAT